MSTHKVHDEGNAEKHAVEERDARLTATPNEMYKLADTQHLEMTDAEYKKLLRKIDLSVLSPGL